jgi:hypothetical protein
MVIEYLKYVSLENSIVSYSSLTELKMIVTNRLDLTPKKKTFAKS